MGSEKRVHRPRRKYRRTPRFFDGKELPHRQLKDLLPLVLQRIDHIWEKEPSLIWEAWSKVVGPRVASMTRVVAYREGKVIVKVNNSTLYSLLSQYEKTRILEKLRISCPKASICDLVFRMG